MDEKSHLAYRAHAQKALYYGDFLIQEPQFVPCEIRQEPAAAALPVSHCLEGENSLVKIILT